MNLHAQNQFCNFFSFWHLKVLIVSLARLGMSDHANLKSHHQLVALLDMYLHAKNQLYTSIIFEILKFKNPAT